MTSRQDGRGKGLRPAVFLDRDGTLIKEKGYLRDPGAVELETGAAEAVRVLNRAGIPVVVVTNQSGIARGYYTQEDLGRIHQTLHRLLAAEGARLDGIFFCPHHPDGTVPAYRTGCACRKPATGMLERAARDLSLRLRGSCLVGDKRTDMQCAEAAGLVGILVTTGFGKQEWLETLRDPASPQPSLVAGSLLEAVERVLVEWGPEAGQAGAGPGRTTPWTCKQVSLEHLLGRLQDHRDRGQTVVFASGVFDLADAGYAESLQHARKQGDLLVVGVNDDASAAAMRGDDRLGAPAEMRISRLSALACVDYCVLLRERTAGRLLEAVRPEVRATGAGDAEATGSGREREKQGSTGETVAGPAETRSTGNSPPGRLNGPSHG